MTLCIVTGSTEREWVRALAALRRRGIGAIVVLLDRFSFDGRDDDESRAELAAVRHALAEYDIGHHLRPRRGRSAERPRPAAARRPNAGHPGALPCLSCCAVPQAARGLAEPVRSLLVMLLVPRLVGRSAPAGSTRSTSWCRSPSLGRCWRARCSGMTRLSRGDRPADQRAARRLGPALDDRRGVLPRARPARAACSCCAATRWTGPGSWSTAASRRSSSPYAIGLGVLMWVTAFMAAYALYRHHRVLDSILLVGVALIANMSATFADLVRLPRRLLAGRAPAAGCGSR